MGWAEKLPSGRYRGVYRDAHGNRRSAGTYTHQAKAERAAGAKEEAARRSMRKDPEAYRRPWGQWSDEWWPTKSVEASTLRNDASRRKNHLDPRWKDVAIGSITRQDVKAWAAQLRRDGLGPESVRRAVHLLSASLSAAVDQEIIDANPAARLKLPGGPPAPERYLTREEYDAIREQLPTTDDQLIADLLVNTGLRWGELAGLHWRRVDLERGMLRVVETFDEPSGRMKAYPKGKRMRDVPLTEDLVTRLAERARGSGPVRSSMPSAAARARWWSPPRKAACCGTRTGRIGCGCRAWNCPTWGTCGFTTCDTPMPHGCSNRASRSPMSVGCWGTCRRRQRSGTRT